jgi:hypothetical protein
MADMLAEKQGIVKKIDTIPEEDEENPRESGPIKTPIQTQ